jgi:RNA polymerase sigma factor (sigma-70 family)
MLETDEEDLNLSELFRRQRGPLVQLARMLTGSLSVAEEVVQEAFLRVMQRNGEGLRNPEAYLRTSVSNLSKTHLRRLGLERRVRPNDRLILEDPELDETWKVLCKLPFQQRAVVALRFYFDLPEADIADVLGCRLGTVKSSLHRGLSTLRRRLS